MNIKSSLKSILPPIAKKFILKILGLKYFLYWPKYIFQYNKYKLLNSKINNTKRFPIKITNLYPCLGKNTSNTSFASHYIYHTAWAARKVREINPDFHVDISSSLYFCALVSAFVPIKFYDYRPANLNLDNLESKHADLNNLYFKSNSIKSISCMHTVEYIGLGRYGDPLNPNGDLKAMQELQRVLAPNGTLLFVVPIGKSKLYFNAHRVYSYEQIISYFPKLSLQEFSLITDSGKFITNANPSTVNNQTYGCGCFMFKKNVD